MGLSEKVSRYFMGVLFLFGAIDGACYLIAGIYLSGEFDSLFLSALMNTTYFWVFMKLIELVGALSLLASYKPAFGLAIITPITAVICLWYLFETIIYIPLGILMIIATVVLFRAYSKSFINLLADQS